MTRAAFGAALALACALAFSAARAGLPLPPVDRVAFAPVPGARLPLDVTFADEHGQAVRLGGIVGARPALVVPAYYGCSNLCTVVLRGVAAGLAASGLRTGRDVDVVAVSIDPHDTPAVAQQKKRAVVPVGEVGWHFLTGDAASITRVTNALGYRYAYVAAEHQYAHASGIAMVAKDGRIARVLYGVAFAPDDLRGALAATRATRAPSSAVTLAHASAAPTWLLCFHYDPHTGRYTFAAMNAARAAGLLALLALVAYGVRALRRERNARASQ
jgi:protein SCO1/2